MFLELESAQEVLDAGNSQSGRLYFTLRNSCESARYQRTSWSL
jgi:hypothetical protein